jgi:hypothetical protein
VKQNAVWKISTPTQLVEKLVLATLQPPNNGRAHGLSKSPALLGVATLVVDEL